MSLESQGDLEYTPNPNEYNDGLEHQGPIKPLDQIEDANVQLRELSKFVLHELVDRGVMKSFDEQLFDKLWDHPEGIEMTEEEHRIWDITPEQVLEFLEESRREHRN